MTHRFVKLLLKVTNCKLICSSNSFERSPTLVPSTKICFWADTHYFKPSNFHRYLFKGKREGGNVVFGCECGSAFLHLRGAKNHLNKYNSQSIIPHSQKNQKQPTFSKKYCSFNSTGYGSQHVASDVNQKIKANEEFRNNVLLEAIRTTKKIEAHMHKKMAAFFGMSTQELTNYLIFNDEIFRKDSAVRMHLTPNVLKEAEQIWQDHFINCELYQHREINGIDV